ncbi:SsgA family sporulation/cell division regulator [Streptomyces sp. S1A1-8]|jgi:Streptomyces sporulation and cell division protein, SsgA.|uniref:SsgA family sporulation/cell division regulator n=1 Tax=Streptomyces TaxID=1883 RepID=UPI0011624168|nr:MULTISPECIES: SsgA family sporulation/cell division regulator [Streptomyces]MCX4615229.1 SsgA family sporulation/cell division regulator [Streptomyces mirabilis]MCX5356557.1 SsgA family sporulation/cell division regulator [Streptomyces mirabilis]QDN84918.1 SsgA family sporulation/cell division regulator [Streptomyces sp. RLB3-6]QDN95495.1 SsgA family sporulation/cell division regulator [Streptomyces sp. RLB1-9]QDO05787.1 SsgA family sporulation/cell division regulator [Streptomyces sp. S1D4
MHRDQSPLQARSAPELITSLFLHLDQMVDEFTPLPIRAEFRFDPDMPAVITVEFLAERGPSLIWRIGRELLHRGLTSMSGCGDVRMWPALPRERPSSWLLLESQEVEALFEVPVAPLAEWLDATYRVTSAEAEMDGLDWENFLVELLDGPGAPSE